MKKMKRFKKVISILLTLAMVLGMSATTFAATTNERGEQKGNLTINGTVKDKEYTLYRVFDLTYAPGSDGADGNYSYTVNSEFAGYFTEEIVGDKTPLEYVESLKDNATAMGALAKGLLNYAVDNATVIEKVKATGTTTVVSNLPYGYYLLNPLGGSGASEGNPSMFALNTLSGEDTTITMKATYPTIDKEVKDDNEDYDKTDEISIGKPVTFKLTTSVPDTTGYNRYWFVISDNMSKGLSFNQIESIKIGDHTLAAENYTVTSTVKTGGGTAVEIVFNDFLKYITDNSIAAGAAIIVEYTATLNADAEIGTGNPNEVTLTYSNDPTYNYNGDKPTGNPNEPTGTTPKVETNTYTTALTINKKDQNNAVLTGAAFRITGTSVNTVITTGEFYIEDENGTYWKLKDGTYTTEDPNADNMDQSKYENVGVAYKKETKQILNTTEEGVNAEGYVGEDGKLTFAGLGAGIYTISEIVTPNGYNSIADKEIKIEFDPEAKQFQLYEKDGENWKAIGNKANTVAMDIVNQSGSELPSTGGIGTTIFYIIGGILVLGAAILLVTKKRMSKEA